MPPRFEDRMDEYVSRIDRALDAVLPLSSTRPERLHEAMRYAVFNGGKRVRPLLTFAAGECVEVAADRLDAAAVAIELIHAFSLVHDDLPAMDNDDLRRGKPTVHVHFDEATAILAADALQPLAFSVLAQVPGTDGESRSALVRLLADACGSLGMTGGQSIDLAAEGRTLSEQELEHMYALKTGALIHAAVVSPCLLADGIVAPERVALENFGTAIGLAFQIRDDLLEVEGNTEQIGKPAGSDAALCKATWPALFGVAASRRRCSELLEQALAELTVFGERAAALTWLARFIVERAR